jgi:hypothetical protein
VVAATLTPPQAVARLSNYPDRVPAAIRAPSVPLLLCPSKIESGARANQGANCASHPPQHRNQHRNNPEDQRSRGTEKIDSVPAS